MISRYNLPKWRAAIFFFWEQVEVGLVASRNMFDAFVCPKEENSIVIRQVIPQTDKLTVDSKKSFVTE